MVRPQVGLDENIVRAIRTSDWDGEKNRFSSDLFRGPNTSVSRLKIFCIEQLFEIFHKDLDRLHWEPPSIVKWAGEINVGKLNNIGRNHHKRTEINVEKDPLPHNIAHAIIPQKLPRNLCLIIIKELIIHSE